MARTSSIGGFLTHGEVTRLSVVPLAVAARVIYRRTCDMGIGVQVHRCQIVTSQLQAVVLKAIINNNTPAVGLS